jgi:hypothetical protein
MKKITLLIASIFIFGGSIANATEKTIFSVERRSPVDFRNADPIVFTERGIEFYVFPDGQLDFNTRPINNGNMYYRSKGRNTFNTSYGAPSNNLKRNYGVKVEHDYLGRVRQVGNVFINYDSNDRVKRIGSVYMTYNRYALQRIGNLEIIYNRRGQIVDVFGAVKGGVENASTHCDDGDNDYGYNNNDNTHDDDYLYYRTTGIKVKIEDRKITRNIAGRLDRN